MTKPLLLPESQTITRIAEPSWVEVSLRQLDANLAWWRSLLVDPKASPGLRRPMICGVVKANAYGMGAAAISARLAQSGIDMLAVYSPAQAEDLFRAGVTCPILTLMPIRELEPSNAVTAAAKSGRLHLTVNDANQLALIDEWGRTFGCRLPVHLHLDTGMSRAGLDSDAFAAALARLTELPGVKLAGLCTHFATAGENVSFAFEQLEKFDRLVAAHRDAVPGQPIVHVANTFAAARDRRFHRDMIRIGLGLHGHGPDMLRDEPLLQAGASVGELQLVVRWLARIVHVQRYTKGSPVGYGCTHTLSRDSVLGVAPAGYADGYPLTLSNRGMVRVLRNGQPPAIAPVLGVVSMDQIVIDLTDISPAATVGDTVELLSNDRTAPNALPQFADLAQASVYEMLCRLSARLTRKYV